MAVEYLLSLFLGVCSGIITGLIPGIHVNLITVIVLSFSGLLLTVTSPLVVAVYIISLAITHSFLDSIPSIYLGAPDAGQELNVLPGHRLLQRGEGHNAIICTLFGSFSCLLLCLVLFPLFLFLMNILSEKIQPFVGYILLVVVILLILREKQKWLKALVLFLFAGVLGLLVFSIPTLTQPLFAMLSGLFGTSLLLLSLFENSSVPAQDFSIPLKLTRKNLGKATGAASGMGFIAAFLPGFGSSQAAIVATSIVGDIGDEGFLTLVGGINTANMLVSIGTVYLLEKARNGAIVGVQDLLTTVTFSDMILFLLVSISVGGIAVIVAVFLSKGFSHFITKVNYQKLVLSVIGFIIILTFWFDGVVGFLILLTATAFGILAAQWKVGKNHLLGCLLLPVILYFLL